MTAPPDPSRVKRYASVIGRWVAVVVIVFTITLWAGKYITDHWLPKKYTAQAEVEVHQTGIVDIPGVWVGLQSPEKIIGVDDAIKAMSDRDVLIEVIRNLNLASAWAKREGYQNGFITDEDALTILQQMVNIQRKEESINVTISVTDNDPVETAAIANAIVDQYKAKRDLEEKAWFNRGTVALRGQIAEMEKTVKNDKTAALDAETKRKLASDVAMLDSLNVRLKADTTNLCAARSPVIITARAEVPTEPSSPHQIICFALTVGAAGLLSLLAGCFIEVIMLFVRASEGEHA